ncbi:MAG: hypothetical protein Q9221_005149 [Calogaya cf. arnoldii]
MDGIKRTVDSIVLDPQLADLLAILKGARNGFTYGAKIRFPHALVMVFLFRSGTLRGKLKLILKATFQHARNLATFATIYKTALLFLRSTSPEGKESSPHTFVAGLVGGYMVFGRGIQSSVNQQIVIYVFARVVLALARLSVQKGGAIPREFRERVTNNAWPVFAALSWASVMWLYRWQPETLQPSLKSSMKYIYTDSDHWDSFRTLLLQNKTKKDIQNYKMPTLKQLTCNVEWSVSGPSIPLQEYGTAYFDGLVETWIAVPPVSTPFSIRLRSDGYIAPGLSMFVYIDGEYQCNRGRNNLKVPTSTTPQHHTNVDFVVRQKEESLSDGNFLGSQWIFGDLSGASDLINRGSSHSVLKNEHMATIEVVVLRSIELQRPRAPVPSVSEVHPIIFNKPDTPKPLSSESAHSSSPDVDTVMSDFGGLFDGASDINERHAVSMPFGGDMAWDDDDQNRGQHFSADWTGGSQPQNAYNSHPGDRSHAPSRSSSIPAASPAVQIFVNQPAASAPAPWSAPETTQWRHAPGSVADSWATPAHDSQAGGKSKNRPPNAPGAWDAASKEKPPQSGGYGWSKSGGASANWNGQGSNQQDNSGWNTSTAQNTGGQTNNDGWSNNDANNNTQDTGWDSGNNGGNDQGNWDSNDQNNTPNDDWGNNNNAGDAYDNNGGNEGWDSGQNDQTNQDDNNQNDQAWNGNDGNGQGDSGWGNTGQGANNSNQQPNNSGDAWDNANAGAQETQGSNANNWNTSTSNQNGWGQNGGANDTFPATTGVSDPAKTKSRRASSGVAKSNLSRRATMNSVAQKTGRKHLNSVHGNGGGFSQPGQQQSGLPGAWPDTSQHAAGFGPFQSGPAAGIKPYHVIPNAAGNPRLPTISPISPISPISEVSAPAPPPKLVENPRHVQRGSPALYQHKIASPRYIDTHDKPYASFIFKYRPKAVLEHILNLNIPDNHDVEKAKLAKLSKEELIEQVIKTKSQFGSKLSSTSSLSATPPSVNNFANGGNRNWVANQNGGNTNQQNNSNNDGWNANNGGNYGNRNTTSGPPGGAFSTELTGKLAALAGQNNNSNSSSGGSNNNQGWNNAPPGSPLANNGNTSFGGPPQIDTWLGGLSKTPVGASVSGDKPWSKAASVRNGGGSNPGGNGSNWAGSQMNNAANGGWNGSRKGNAGNVSRTRSQKSGARSQESGGWNNKNSGDGGWNSNGNNNGAGGTQTNDRGNSNNNDGGGWTGNGNGNGNGWNGGNNHGGDQANNSGGGNNGNGGGGWDNNNGNGNGSQQPAAVGGW